MSAKKKSSDKDVGSYVEPNQNPELEKKIDEMLSFDEVREPDSGDSKKTGDTPQVPEEDDPTLLQVTDTPVKAAGPQAVPPAATPAPTVSETSSAPLLPTEKLPDLSKKKKITVVDHDDVPPEEPEPDATPIAPTEPAAAEEEVPEPILPESEAQETPETTDLDPIEPESPILEDESVEPANDDLGLEEQSTSKAVDDIVAEEADELLAANDRMRAHVEPAAPAKPKGGLFKRFISGWWHSKLYRNTTLALLGLGIAAGAVFPASRYYVLNTAGVRASSSVTILDLTNNQPLKNASFSIGEISAKTDSEGKAKLSNLKLGPTTMKVQKPAFAEVGQPVTIGWGSNPLGEYKMKAVGVQYTFKLTDFVTKQAIGKAEAASGQADARSNEKGELVLTIPRTELDELEVQITADDYRTEKVKLSTRKIEPTELQMVPSKKHVFVSKRSGKFDVFKIDIDGKNEEKVLSGTGIERSEAMALSVNPSKNKAALVSTRDSVRNKDGFNLSTLTLIDLSDNETTKVAQSERIQLVDWIGSKLIFVKIAEGESAASPNRHRLVSYDIESKSERELASSNYFNDVVAANGSIYYSPALYQVNGQVGLYKINAEGNNRKMVYDKEVWNIFRTTYDKLSVSIGQDWYDLNLSNDSMAKAGGAPPVLKTRIYFDNPDATTSLWVDDRDGKGVLLGYDKSSKEDKVLQTRSGLKNPVRWLDGKHYIYRVSTSQETADYVAGLSGDPIKIRDVTDTGGIDRWYYY